MVHYLGLLVKTQICLHIGFEIITWWYLGLWIQLLKNSSNLTYTDFAKEVWDDLKIRFWQGSGTRMFHLKQELVNIWQEEDSMASYFTKIKIIWEELNDFRPSCSCT